MELIDYQLRRTKRLTATRIRKNTCNKVPNPEILAATESMNKRDAARASSTTLRKVHVGACINISSHPTYNPQKKNMNSGDAPHANDMQTARTS